MSDLIALWIGRCVMGLAGLGVVTLLAWLALQLFWALVVRPYVGLADILLWKRAKANGGWREPQVRPSAEERT